MPSLEDSALVYGFPPRRPWDTRPSDQTAQVGSSASLRFYGAKRFFLPACVAQASRLCSPVAQASRLRLDRKVGQLVPSCRRWVIRPAPFLNFNEALAACDDGSLRQRALPYAGDASSSVAQASSPVFPCGTGVPPVCIQSAFRGECPLSSQYKKRRSRSPGLRW